MVNMTKIAEAARQEYAELVRQMASCQSGAIPGPVSDFLDANAGNMEDETVDTTRRAFLHRQNRLALRSDGFQPVSANGEPLGRFQRDWTGRYILDVRIGPDRQTLWIKVSEP